jgi:hypothetical protein
VYAERPSARRRQWHWWIVAIDPEDPNGQPYLLYGCLAEEGEDKARQKGFELLNGLDFQLRKFPTRRTSEASQYLRGKRLEQTRNLHQSVRRIKHERSLLRAQKRWRTRFT